MQSCVALRFLVTPRPPLHEAFAFLSNIKPRLAFVDIYPKVIARMDTPKYGDT